LYELETLIHRLRGQKIHQHLRWDELTVIVDSPLAAKFNVAYQQLSPYWDAEARTRLRAGRHPLSFQQLHTIDSHAEHLTAVNLLSSTRKPAIVIAASGMCEGGRVVNYLKAMLGDPVHQVVFVGYQARGTLGAAIQRFGPRGGYVVIDGERIDIRAEVLTLGGYSAHADQQGLVNFIKGMRRKPQHVRIVHGDLTAKQALQNALSAYVNHVIIS
jgi:metallo-beta-lactamase family protein